MRLSQFAIVLAILLPAMSADARPLTSGESGSLGKAVSGYLAAIEKNDAKGIVGALPPRVIAVFAGATGMEEKALTATLTEQTSAMLAGTTVRDVTADESALDAEDADLADGSKVTWVLIPTAFVSEVKGKATRNEQPLLAVSEKGKWYFLRVDGKERRDLAAVAYPFLKDQTIPGAKVTPVP
ncbi:MAG: hypothetical protein KDE00_05485 [Rhodobacteraceae bacterium]|nr:hypothetical protein [Paracoccaceae bacterium]